MSQSDRKPTPTTSCYYNLYTSLSSSPRDDQGKICPLLRGTRRRGTVFLAWVLHKLTGAGVSVVEEGFYTYEGREGKRSRTVFARRAK